MKNFLTAMPDMKDNKISDLFEQLSLCVNIPRNKYNS